MWINKLNIAYCCLLKYLVSLLINNSKNTIMKQYRETQTGQAKCLQCTSFNKCPLACSSFTFCPAFSAFVDLATDKRLFVRQHNKPALFTVHEN